ncbi:hypothetical protein N185_30535 [Sinorhizobium sp. GW3]|nr:hypothetical protein N185_30535 [Sinorhizobium sp. GW3]
MFAITSEDNVDASSFARDSSIKPSIVFTVERSGGTTQKTYGDCEGSLIAKGSENPKLAYFLKFERQTLPGAFAATLVLVKSVVVPIYKVIRGHDLADLDAENLAAVNTVVDAYKDYLAMFTSPHSTAKTVPLKEGNNILRTSVSRVVINVRKVDSFLLSNIKFRANYERLVEFKPSFNKENLRLSCGFSVKDLATQGFKSQDDQAFIMYKTMNDDIVSTKKDIVECLGPSSLAPFVIKNRKLFVDYFPEAINSQ